MVGAGYVPLEQPAPDTVWPNREEASGVLGSPVAADQAAPSQACAKESRDRQVGPGPSEGSLVRGRLWQASHQHADIRGSPAWGGEKGQCGSVFGATSVHVFTWA